MGRNSFLKFPKIKEEQLVPDSIDAPEFFEANGDYNDTSMDDQFEGILGIKDEELQGEGSNNVYDDHDDLKYWDFMDSEEFSFNEIENDSHKVEDSSLHFSMVKRENCEFWDEDEAKKMCLNLSLNYQDVMDAWSDRGSLWAEDCSPSPDANNGYMGEVPITEEDKARREASVLRYKEKRQNRLFAKKIRYQVRKLNADNRPRLKGRFVRRESCEDTIK